MNKQKIRITYLYPHHMNLYGDTGNILALKRRCEMRDIEFDIRGVSDREVISKGETDLYFFGGGQDAQQIFVSDDLKRIRETIVEDVEAGVVALAVCGGYQLFGKFYRPFNGDDLEGISLFDVETYASHTRMIGNVVVRLSGEIIGEMQNLYEEYISVPQTLVGFENHSGQTRPGIHTKVIGDVIVGFGNNENDQKEGFNYKNAYGTYLHGSLLPKNPHFADLLIVKALRRSYGPEMKLCALDDELAYLAHTAVVRRFASETGKID